MMPDPTRESKRKLADAVIDEPAESALRPTKLQKETDQTANQLDENVSKAKDDEHRAEVSKAKHESLAINKRDDNYPTILPGFRQSSISPSKRRLRLQSNLCAQCSKLPFETLLSRPHKTQLGQLAKNLNPVPDWKIESCAFCSLLYSAIEPVHWPSGRKVPLRTFSSNKMTNEPWSSISVNLLQVGYRERYIVSQPEGMEGPVRIVKGEIERTEFERVKDWISLCRDKHTKICSIENTSSVPGLKLIDFITKDIVPAEDKPYLALSYVWGSGLECPKDPRSTSTKNKLPENLPNTIKDAIIVAKKLGYRYLWVDRYCIDQNNEEETTDQCGKMDLIYQNAEITIIAAVGEDPTYGLPGVGLRQREPQNLTACSKIAKHFLISAQSTPREAVGESKWRTRAWTYQEALLSRRRLVFTDEQMYFECYGMYCGESVHFPLQAMHRKDMQGFKSAFCSGNSVGIFPKGVGTTSIEIVKRIEEYSKLTLSNASDILRGMLGIFNAFHRSRLGIDHCLGIPILPSMMQRAKPIEGWTPSMGFFFGLFWDIPERSERRNGFPSWSWTGWYGSVEWKWGYMAMTWLETKVEPDVQLSVELIDGQILKWEAFQEINREGNMLSRLSNTIRLKAWITDVSIRKRQRKKDKDEYTARLNEENGGYLDWRFTSTSKFEFLPGQVCKGIILGHERSHKMIIGPAIMVVGEIDGKMERIGLGWVDQWYYKRWNKDGVLEGADDPELAWVNPIGLEPIELAKSWEEIRLG